MKKFITVLAATGILTATASAFALPAMPSLMSKFYLHADLGIVHTNNIASMYNTSWDYNHANQALGGGIDGGFIFIPHVGVELGYMRTLQATTGKNPGAKGGITNDSFYAAGKVQTGSLIPHFNIYGLLGYSYSHVHDDLFQGSGLPTDNHCYDFMGGVGVDYKIYNNFSVGVKYLTFAVKKTNKMFAPNLVPTQYYLATVGYSF